MGLRVPGPGRIGRVVLLAFVLAVPVGTVVGLGPGAGPFGDARHTMLFTPAGAGSIPLDHIVIVMMENHVYDNYFGTYCLVVGPYCSVNGSGLPPGICVPLYPSNPSLGCQRPYLNPIANLTMGGLLPHSWSTAHTSYDNGSNDGFYLAERKELSTFSYYDGTEIPSYWSLAQQYGLGDNFYASVLSDSRPNHWFLVAGGAPQSGIQGGLLRGSNYSQLTPFDETYLNQSNATPTIVDQLINSSVTWKYYDWNLSAVGYAKATSPSATIAGPGSAFDFWNPLAAKASSYRAPIVSHMVDYGQFNTDAMAGRLPNVSWVIPRSGFSDHPPANLTAGENFITGIVNAVAQGPQWNRTAIFVTWDDYGGFYDHMPPPPLDANGVSMRVPLLVIGPYVRQNYISHHFEYFDSLLRFVEWRFHLNPITDRDAFAPVPLEYFDFNATPRPPMLAPNASTAVYPARFQGLGAPPVPQNLTGSSGPGSVTLNWTLPKGYPGVGAYVLTYGPSATPTQSTVRLDGSLLSATVSNLVGSSLYQFALRSVTAGNLSSIVRLSATPGAGSSPAPLLTAATWQTLPNVGTTPSARQGATFVFDAADQTDLLFGGLAPNGTYLSDTWEYRGGSWLKLAPTSTPSARAYAAAAYVSADGKVVMFGGQSASGARGDTWTFSGNQWTNVTTTASRSGAPSPRSLSTFSDDPGDGFGVLFGGATSTGRVGDTWTFSGGAWSPLGGSSTRPPARSGAASTYDARDAYLVLYGGTSVTGAYLNDTWQFSAGTWHQVPTLATPGGRQGAVLVYDARDKYVVLFSGATAGGLAIPEWKYSGGGWSVLHPAAVPTARAWASGVYDGLHLAVVMGFGTGANGALADLASYSVPASVRLTASPTYGVSPLLVSYTPSVSGGMLPYAYRWSFGDGGTGSILYPSHYFLVAGDYVSSLTVTDGGGVPVSVSVPIHVMGPLGAVASAGTPAPNGTVNFTSNVGGGWAPYSYAWSFGDAGPNATLANPTHRYSGNGTFHVQLTVTDAHGYTTVSNLTVTVTVGAAPLGIRTDLTRGPAPLSVSFDLAAAGARAACTCSWEFGDGSPTEMGASVQHDFLSVGTYRVDATVATAAGGTTRSTTWITVTPPLEATAHLSTVQGAAPLPVSFGADPAGGSGPYVVTWTFGDGAIAVGTTATHVFSEAGTYSVVMAAEDAAGSRVVEEFVVDAVAPTVAPSHSIAGSVLAEPASSVVSSAPLAAPSAAPTSTAAVPAARWEPEARSVPSARARSPASSD